ncbi:MAG: hypothetical protein Q4G69_05175, partial [Planctomycetia bacterium]|nr:hypothetical protein [Planctomycetia bacterium]
MSTERVKFLANILFSLAVLAGIGISNPIFAAVPKKKAPQKPDPTPSVSHLLSQFRKEGMRSVHEILFAVRKPGIDGHYYANFGYYAARENRYPFHPHGGGALRVLNLDTKKVRTVYEEKKGSVRDPILHYSGKKILFSLLKEGTDSYNLYEINLDGSGLRQITFGDRDDIEPCYLPNGDILFCSTRSNRYVQCWLTHVATIHRCGPNGENIRPLSANVEQDNTPWVLDSGQIIYTRWEYVDREQVTYHHLWTMNPDGTRQMVLFGNQFKYMLFIGAKPIPNSQKIVATIAPGHGRKEHYGRIAVIDPLIGPDDFSAAQYISKDNDHSDPWAFSESEFMAAKKNAL